MAQGKLDNPWLARVCAICQAAYGQSREGDSVGNRRNCRDFNVSGRDDRRAAASCKQEPFARWPMRGRYRDRCDDSGRCAKGFARSRCVASGAYGHLGRQPGPRRAFPEAQAEHVALRQFTDDVDGRCWLSSATAQMRCQRRLSGLVVMRRQCSAIAGAFGGSGSGRRISGVIVIMRCRRRRDPGSAHQ